MKKVICALLALIITLTPLVSCKDKGSKPTIAGKEAARLLLAEERLNAGLLKKDGDIFDKGVETMNTLSERAIESLAATVPEGYRVQVRSARARTAEPIVTLEREGSFGEEKNNIGNMQIVADSVVWSDFGEVSNSYEYFLNLTNCIVSNAQIAAETIDYVKKNLRVVDKVIQLDAAAYYLSVTENSELMIFHDTINQILNVVRRYRNEDGRDVYELYAEDATSNYVQRMTYVPGERYELKVDDVYFVASSDKGYWETYVVVDTGDHFNTSYLIMKDDICYAFHGMGEVPENVPITILSSDRQTDILNLQGADSQIAIRLSLCAFDGIEKISAPKADVDFGPNYDFAAVSGSQNVVIHLENGKTITPSTTSSDRTVSVNDIMVGSYAYGYAPEITLRIAGDTYDECLQNFKSFLKQYGLTCRRDIDTVLAGVTRAQQEIPSICRYFCWNGIAVSNSAAIRESIAVEDARCAEMRAYYEALKNVEVINGYEIRRMELDVRFAPITARSTVGVSLYDLSLTAQAITLTVEDTALFVTDEPYVVALALADSSGGLIHLEQSTPVAVLYDGSSAFTVTATDVSLTLPHLPAGTYTLVAYLSTADGIRSSAYTPIAATVEHTGVRIQDVTLTGASSASGLVLTYSAETDVRIALTSDVRLDYDAFETMVYTAVFAYGIPADAAIERLTDDGYAPLSKTDETVSSGTYRVAYTLQNGTTTLAGYVVIDYEMA